MGTHQKSVPFEPGGHVIGGYDEACITIRQAAQRWTHGRADLKSTNSLQFQPHSIARGSQKCSQARVLMLFSPSLF